MITITNIWGIFFCMVVQIVLMIFGAYISGLEEGRMRHARNKNRHRTRKSITKTR